MKDFLKNALLACVESHQSCCLFQDTTLGPFPTSLSHQMVPSKLILINSVKGVVSQDLWLSFLYKKTTSLGVPHEILKQFHFFWIFADILKFKIGFPVYPTLVSHDSLVVATPGESAGDVRWKTPGESFWGFLRTSAVHTQYLLKHQFFRSTWIWIFSPPGYVSWIHTLKAEPDPVWWKISEFFYGWPLPLNIYFWYFKKWS